MLTEQERDSLRARMTERDLEIVQRHLLLRFEARPRENGRRRADAPAVVQALRHRLRPADGERCLPALRGEPVARVSSTAGALPANPSRLVRAEGAAHRPGTAAADLSRRVVTRAEAAELTRQSVRTIAQLMHDGLVEVVYTANGRPRIVESSLWRDGPPSSPADA